jgi:ABC-type multidrug transport system fused ATPase/permease subunit
LICLGRVLLQPSSILVLDEATAFVDRKTDNHIQKILKEKFQNTTIITIAHRLNTIADYDNIIVMDDGKVA